MAGYTKEEYDNLYSFRVERYLGGFPVADIGVRPEFRCHYHKAMMKPVLATMWANIQPVLQIQSTDYVAIVGAGFGWGVEAAIAETGATIVGVDISDYIATEQGNTETAELRALITANGLDPDTGRGAEILAFLDDGQPRSNVVVLQEDMQTNQSRNAIRSALGNNNPTVVVFEDLVDDTTTDQEITAANNYANLWAGQQRIIWIYRGTPLRSLQDLQTLTGSEVITPDGQTHLGAPA